MIAHTCVQDEFLETLVNEQTVVNVFLVNGIRLSGQISAYDCFTVMLKSGPSVEVVFKHVISTVLPDNGSGPTRDPSDLPVSRASRATSELKSSFDWSRRQVMNLDPAKKGFARAPSACAGGSSSRLQPADPPSADAARLMEGV